MERTNHVQQIRKNSIKNRIQFYPWPIWLIFLFISPLSISYSSANSVTQSDCLQYDHSSKMGPQRDQRTNGQCWAFAGSALLEEELCFQDPRLCGKSISPLDASRCEWTIGKKNEGGLTRYALNCALQNGVCLEEKAPYDEKVDLNLNCTAPSTSAETGNERPEIQDEKKRKAAISTCADSKTQREYQDFLAQYQNKICTPPAENSLIQFLGAQSEISDEFLCQEKDHKLPPESLFRKKMLIPPECQKNRLAFQRASQLKGVAKSFPGGIDDLEKTPASQKYKQLAQIIKENKRSVALSLCVNKISPELSRIFTPTEDNCSGHGVVVSGSRWHNGRCQLFIKNSWGDIPDEHPAHGTLQDWVDAENVLNATFGLEYLSSQKKSE